MHQIRLPSTLDPGIGPLVVDQWLIHQGHKADQGQVLVRIQTPGATIELKSPVQGILGQIMAQEGQVLEPGQAICTIGESPQDQPVAQAAPAQSRVIPILMPQAGQTMEEGTIIAWKVKQGDWIKAGQVILEIETDKATMEVEATDSGRLARILAQPGQVVPVKTPIAYLADTDADLEAFLASSGTDAPVEVKQGVPQTAAQGTPGPQTIPTPPSEPAERPKASPAARRIAKELGIDLANMPPGSGPGGRILSTDLQGIKTPQRPAGLSRMRLAIAKNLLWSKQNIPHFYAKRVVDAQALMATYRASKHQYGCTINDFIVAATARALVQFPQFRGQFKDNAIVQLDSINIGIAVGTDQGLVVPVLVDADKLDFGTLVQRVRRIIDNARQGKLEASGQGVLTITNLGMFGIEEFYAIINPPESAILAVGTVRDGTKIQQGHVLPTQVMSLCLSVDHRVIDGVLAAQFLARLAELLEKPEVLLE